jgi:hypothetical protein
MSWRFLHCSCKDIHYSQILTLRFVGIFLSFLIPETKRRTLEEMTGEDHYLRMEVPQNGANSDNEKAV